MAYIQEKNGSIDLTVKVVPGASQSRLAGRLGDALKVMVAAPPEKGKANAAVERLLAECLNVPVKAVSIISGLTNPRKVVRVTGLSAEEAIRRLGVPA